MEKIVYNKKKSEEGYILIATLLMMLVLTIIGIATNRNTSIELQIAGNDRTQKETFYKADGGTELATEVVEQNTACYGFTSSASGDKTLEGAASYNIYVDNDSLGFWGNYLPTNPADILPSDSLRDFYYSFDNNATHTNVKVGGKTVMNTGAALQMAAGYEGLGKAIGAGGVTLVYDINVQHLGLNNSESTVCIKYRHIVGREGDCYYE